MVLTSSDYDKLHYGDIAPDFNLKATDEKQYSLKELKGKLTLIVFMCNHCPYVRPKISELNRIAQAFNEVRVIGINPNESINYPEDSFDNMKRLVETGYIKFIYLHDDTQKIAKDYGAVCTPDPFLFDKDLELIYHGRIDDSHAEAPAKKHELYDFISEYLKTGKSSIEVKPSMGCSMKWKY